MFNTLNFEPVDYTDAKGEKCPTYTFSKADKLRFVIKVIAEALEYAESSNAARLFASVPEEWAGMNRIHIRSENGVEQGRYILCLSEQGLYFFLAWGDKPKALPFQTISAKKYIKSANTLKQGNRQLPTSRRALCGSL